jgi:hypothetical protein
MSTIVVTAIALVLVFNHVSFSFKNNTDSTGNSYGCHENYLVSRDTPFPRLVEALIPFLVTRQIFTGAGKITRVRAVSGTA